MSDPSRALTAHSLRAGRASLSIPASARSGGNGVRNGVRSRLVHLLCVLAITLSTGATAFVPDARANAQSGSGESRVATTDLNLRAQPSTSSAVLTVIPGGRSVTVTGGNQNGFLPVRYSGVNGFAYADFLGSGAASGNTAGNGSSGATGGTSVLVSLNLRGDASTSSQVLAVMPAGATVQLLGEQRNGFVRVTYNGTRGWASGQFLGSGGAATPSDGGTNGGTSSGATGAARSTTDLNLRSGAGTSFAVIGVIPAGGQVQLTGTRQNNFAQLTYNGTQGWASLDFLTSGGGSGSSPVVPDDGDVENGASGTATVNGSLNLRASASTSAQIVDVMPGGARVQVLGPRQNGFAQVTYNGSQGWAFEQYLTSGGSVPEPSDSAGPAPTQPTTPPSSGSAPSGPLWATVSLNLRSGPGTTFSVLTVMPAGSSGTSTGQSQNGFWSLNYNGTNGWASASLLSTDGGSAVDPAPTAPGNAGSYSQDQIIQIIYAAADRYGQPRADMLRVARCESVLDPNAVNASGGSYGLFQFIPSTWATTPYAGDNIFDAYASANAAGWMWQQGRRNEWVCQ